MSRARLPGVVLLYCALALTSPAALGAPPAAGSRAVPRVKHAKQVKKNRPKPSAGARCVTLAQETNGQTLDLSLTNACAAHVSCSLGWVVRCGHARDTTAHPGAESLVLADGASQTVTASAAECGGKGWRIGAIRWRCTRN
jgi:hypothetical protein